MSEVSVAPAPTALRSLTRRATLWTTLGQVSSQVLRLGSNLILTRLLLPEFFGVMVIINVFVLGLGLFSDVGLGPNIIRHKRGEDAEFLNTAWTIQIIRGFILWGCAWALAGVMAGIYEIPELTTLLPVAALTAVIGGFESTARYSLNRKIHLGRVTLLELGQQVSSITFMVVWAALEPSIWALVCGGVFGALVRTASSHFLLPGIRNRWRWDKEAARSLISFGKWIFLSTALGFLANRGDRLILGAAMTQTELGVFSVAAILAHSPVRIAGQISMKVLLPLYSRLSDEGPGTLNKEIGGTRRRMTLMAIALLSVIALGGEFIVTSLWPETFWDAGRMTRILAIGSIGSVTIATLQPVLLACGDGRAHFISTLSRAVLLLGALLVGQHFGGVTGALVGLAAAPTLHYPVLALLVHRHRAWTPLADVWGLFASLFLAGCLIAGY
jgi:O-antigen/teichoic acid export membrane protein